MSKTYTVTEEQLQAAVRRALSPAFECLDETTPDVEDNLEYAVADITHHLEHVLATPCPCVQGIHCPYRGTPTADANTTGHCEECGAYMPDRDAFAKPGYVSSCRDCDAQYARGASADAEEPEEPYVAPADLDADDDGIIDRDQSGGSDAANDGFDSEDDDLFGDNDLGGDDW